MARFRAGALAVRPLGATAERWKLTQYETWGTTSENTFAVYNAVECADVNWPRNWSKWQADTWSCPTGPRRSRPDNVWFNAACAFLGGDYARGQLFTVDGSGLPPVLMLQGTLDPATPYAGAQDAHRLLPSARMVVVEGGGNHGVLSPRRARRTRACRTT